MRGGSGSRPELSGLVTDVKMADYYSSTVVQQTIPNADMSPLECLLLTHIFESEPDGDDIYFFASEATCDVISVNRAELEAALSASEQYKSSVISFVKDRLTETADTETEVEMDFSLISWEPMFQDIVRRSPTLNEVTGTSQTTEPRESPTSQKIRPLVLFAFCIRFDLAILTNVARMRQDARTVPRRLPATFDVPPARRRYGIGIS